MTDVALGLARLLGPDDLLRIVDALHATGEEDLAARLSPALAPATAQAVSSGRGSYALPTGKAPRSFLMRPDFKGPTDANWGAVSRRDRRFDGRFVYVALTTKIYCRPSCPARLPQRERVIILPTAADAERRGYSACRRCHPGANALAPAEKSIQLALEFIEGHLDTPMTLRALSQASGLSPKHLQRVVEAVGRQDPLQGRYGVSAPH